MKPESEFNELKPHLKSLRKPVSIERRLESWNVEYDFKRKQPYLSRGSNSLISASDFTDRMRLLLTFYEKFIY